MTSNEDLIALERRGWQALCDGRGGEFYRDHLTDDAMMAFPFGVMGRQAAIDAMEQAPPWVTFQMVDPQVVRLTEDSGIVVYGVTAHRAQEQPFSAVVSSTFVRRGGRWLLAFHQQSPP